MMHSLAASRPHLDLALIPAHKAAWPAPVHQRNSTSMSRSSLRAAVFVLLAALLPFAPMGTLPAAAQTPAQSAPSPATGLTVSVVRPQMQPLVETLLVTGSLLPREEIQVGPEVEGLRLEEILVAEGDKVTKGQVLARLSRDMLEVQLAQNAANEAKARAAIAQQRATLDQALAQEAEAAAAVDRSRQLRKTGVVSQEALDERERAAKVTTAQVAAAREGLLASEAEAVFVKAQRSEIELRLERTNVKAPYAGTVLDRDARIGSIALSARADSLFRIAKDGAIDLDAEVPEPYMPRLAVGQSVRVTPTGFATPFEGRVRLISAELDKSTRLGRVQVALPDDPRLRPGTFARGVVELDRRDGLMVPQSAVMFDTEGAYVLVVSDGTVATRRVQPGLKADGRVEVVGGLTTSDMVVVRAGGFLRDGDRVSPVEMNIAAKDVR